MSDAVLLSGKGLRKSYGGVLAVNDVDISLRAGEIVGLVGPNGAGKTTLVDILSGTQEADSGTLELDGTRVAPTPFRRAQAGFARTYQHPQVAHSLTVRENVLLGVAGRATGTVRAAITGFVSGILAPRRKGDEEIVARRAHEVSLGGLDRLAGDLTLGEQRLVEVARALAQGPRVLLLDEPFAGADTGGLRGIIDAIVAAQRQGCGVLLVDHNVDLVASLVDRIVLLAEGSVAFDGAPQACMSSPEMIRVYFGEETR